MANPDNGYMLAVGNQRSYSDVCVSSGKIIKADKQIYAFHLGRGEITCGAGATLGEVAKVAISQGWFFAVTPGTRYATIGGCIANDIHGKNHQAMGTFGHWTISMNLALYPTIGGLGLTGLIEWATIQLVRQKYIFKPWYWPLDIVPYYWPIYKRLGFWQYHCVVPAPALKHLYREITQKPLLIVHKRFGNRPPAGMLSFCRPGISLSLDFARPDTGMMARLDRVVMDSGGAVYPAKTSMSKEMFQASFPRWKEFQKYADPAFSSSFSRRVGLTSG